MTDFTLVKLSARDGEGYEVHGVEGVWWVFAEYLWPETRWRAYSPYGRPYRLGYPPARTPRQAVLDVIANEAL